MYYYFVSYSFKNSKENRQGLGCAQITHDKPITQFNDIIEMANCLEKDAPNFGKFKLISFQQLRIEDESQKEEPKVTNSKYHYFISYSFSNAKIGKTALDYSEIVLDKPITHFNDILDIANTLSKNNILAEKCTILNFQLLRVENENE